MISEILSKKLLIVTGKGGVGKTTVSLALALIAAEKGKKVLLVEVNSEEQIARLLERPPIGYNEVELLPKLWGINVEPKQAFREYVLRQIKFKTLYKAVFENRLVRNFIEATPGLADLMNIGKIHFLTDNYDLVVVDAPASGHTIGLLQIPSVVSNAVRIGPLKSEAGKIDDLIHDKNQTMIVGVTLPEEMPVTETIEMSEWLRERLNLSFGPIFLNQVQPVPFTKKDHAEIKRLQKKSDDPFFDAIDLQIARAYMSSEYSEKLKESLPDHPIVPIPFIYSSHFGLTEIETIAGEIEEAIP